MSRARELASATVLLLGAVAAVLQAWKLPFGSVAAPGAGFFPLLLALGLGVTALALVVRAAGAPPGGAEGAAPGRKRNLLIVVVALFAYTAVLDRLGFVLATFLMMLALFRAVQAHRWPVALAESAAAAVIGYVVFRTWLGVRLPLGPWGF